MIYKYDRICGLVEWAYSVRDRYSDAALIRGLAQTAEDIALAGDGTGAAMDTIGPWTVTVTVTVIGSNGCRPDGEDDWVIQYELEAVQP